MKFMYGLFALLMTFCMVGTAQAARNVTTDDKVVEISTGSGKAPSADEARKAIRSGGIGKGWTAFDKGPGKVKLDLDVKGKYNVSVEVLYNSKTYTVKYLSSENMKFDQGKIHPKYAEWIGTLIKGINAEFGKL